MSTPCVLAVQQDSLLDRALTGILKKSQSDLRVITFKANDVSGLIAETLGQKPDMVLLGESMALAAEDALFQLLMSFPSLRVIVVSDDTNWLHIFQKKDKLMTRQSDLLDVLCVD